MKKLIILFALVISLVACASDAPPVAVKPQADTGAKIPLDVLTVVVLDRSVPDFANSPYTTNNFQPTIANAIRLWAQDKFVAAGNTGEAVIVIREASLKGEKLPHNEGDWFKRSVASKYVGRADIEINITGNRGPARVTADATRYEQLLENPTTIERQNAYYSLLNGLMRDLSSNTRTAVAQHLGAYVLTARP